jgi:Kef-type K+ transport system membrane component KefB
MSAQGAEVEWTFWQLLLFLLFLGATWAGAHLAQCARLPALIGEVLVGCLLGPPLADAVPFAGAVSLLGGVGIVLLTVEAGLEVDVAMLKSVGPRGVAVALCGSVFGPFLAGFGLATAAGCSARESLAVGAALAPTSMGCAVVLFKEARMLNTPVGQTVVAAAVLDDIIALVLLSELQALRKPSKLAFIVPIVSALAFLVGIGAFAVMLVPKLMARVLPRVPSKHVPTTVLALLFTATVGLMAALHAGRASHLLGAFLGGLCFSSLPSVHALWQQQVKRLQTWLLRLFFSATVGFNIPIRHLWTPRVWALGTLFTCALALKLATGLLARPLTVDTFLAVGCAMAAWGEFAFLVANTALAEGTLSAEVHAAVSLAVLLSLLIGPASLRLVLRRMNTRAAASLAQVLDAGAAPLYLKLDLRVQDRWALLPDILGTLAAYNVTVLDCRVDSQAGLTLLEAFLRDDAACDESHLSALRVALAENVAHDPLAELSEREEDNFAILRGIRLVPWSPTHSDGDPVANMRASSRLRRGASAQLMPHSEEGEHDGDAGRCDEEGGRRDDLLLRNASAADVADDCIASADADAAEQSALRDEGGTGLAGMLRSSPVPGTLARTRSARSTLVRVPSVALRRGESLTMPAAGRGALLRPGSVGAHEGVMSDFERAVLAFRRGEDREMSH